MLELVERIGQEDAVDQLREPITQMTETNAAGFALVFGLLGALWSASGYVGAFGRAMNRIYEVDEGRPFWKLRPLNLVITVVRSCWRRRAARPRRDRAVRRGARRDARAR